MSDPRVAKRRRAVFPRKTLIWLVYIYSGTGIAISIVTGEETLFGGFIAILVMMIIWSLLQRRFPSLKSPAPIDRRTFVLVLIPTIGFLVLTILQPIWQIWFVFSLFMSILVITGIALWRNKNSRKSLGFRPQKRGIMR